MNDNNKINYEKYWGKNDEKAKDFFGLFGDKYSLYQTAMKFEKGFPKKFKEEKEKLLKQNNKCAICGKPFEQGNIHLHHKKDWKDEAIKKRDAVIEGIKNGTISPKEAYKLVKEINDNIYSNYINFKDVILICKVCHTKEHESYIMKRNLCKK